MFALTIRGEIQDFPEKQIKGYRDFISRESEYVATFAQYNEIPLNVKMEMWINTCFITSSITLLLY